MSDSDFLLIFTESNVKKFRARELSLASLTS